MAKTAQGVTAKPATGPAAPKKNHFASTLLILPLFFFLLAILGLNFINPLDTYAHPSYGFTPQPPPPPPPHPGGNDEAEDEDEDDELMEAGDAEFNGRQSSANGAIGDRPPVEEDDIP